MHHQPCWSIQGRQGSVICKMVSIDADNNVWDQETYIQQDFETCKMVLEELNNFSTSCLLARNSDTIGCTRSDINHVLEFWMGHHINRLLYCVSQLQNLPLYNSKLTWSVATRHSIEASRKVSCEYGITHSETFLSTRWPLIFVATTWQLLSES